MSAAIKRKALLTALLRRRRLRISARRLGGVHGPVLPAVLTAAAGLCLVGLFLGFALTRATYLALEEGMPQVQDFHPAPLAQTSVVLDASGTPVAELPGAERREVVASDELDPDLKEAIVAVEDQRFYLHSGVDTPGIARAAWQNVRYGGVAQGGSTLTQQLMRLLYLPPEQRQEVSLTRKWVEGALALGYEREHTKREILTKYLNAVYFGGGAYGAEAASRTYFSKGADDLETHEAALLAGIVQLPTFYDPFTNPDAAQARRDVVLDRMRATGYLNEEQYSAAVAKPLSLSHGDVIQAPEELAHYVAAVRRELVATVGTEAVERGGLKVKTALDPAVQQAARAAADETLDPGDPAAGGDPAAAVASVEPGTGRVRALVSHSGTSYAKKPFDLATQAKRQPGSTFKAFVLSAALEADIPLSARYDSQPLSLPGGYDVNNYRNEYRGTTTVREGLVYSDNSVFVQLALDAGMERVVDVARRMGIAAPLEPYPSTAIGGLTEGVSPVELAGAYATIADEGSHTPPHVLLSVEQTNQQGESNRIYEEPQPEPAIDPFIASETQKALRSVVTDGGDRLSALDGATGRQIAGKTGTTEMFRDAWFVGYPLDADGSRANVVTAVWIGYPDAEEPMAYVNGYPEVDGSTVPLDIYARFMSALSGSG